MNDQYAMSYDYFEEEEEWYPVYSPKFPIDCVVAVQSDHQLDEQGFPGLNTKGWHGRVEDTLTNGSKTVCSINLDSPTIASLPEAFLKMLCEESPLPSFEFLIDELQVTAPRDTVEEAVAAQRALYHRYFWGDIEKDQQATRIHRIMMKNPSGSDLENWLDFFQNEVQYPLPAVAAGLVFTQLPHGTPVEVVGIEGLDEEECFGIIASVRKGRAIISYPLMELGPASEHARCWPIKDYQYWADFML